MILYQTKINKLSGTSYAEVREQALIVYKQIQKRTKRKPYIRSAYFNKQKIFFDYFWIHLHQKSPKERFKRLKYFEVAIDLIKNSKNKPIFKQNPNKKTEIVYRFFGSIKNKEKFYVQIKENTRSKRKYFMSCFSGK